MNQIHRRLVIPQTMLLQDMAWCQKRGRPVSVGTSFETQPWLWRLGTLWHRIRQVLRFHALASVYVSKRYIYTSRNRSYAKKSRSTQQTWQRPMIVSTELLEAVTDPQRGTMGLFVLALELVVFNDSCPATFPRPNVLLLVLHQLSIESV